METWAVELGNTRLIPSDCEYRSRNSMSLKNLIFKGKTSVASTTSIESNLITSFMKVDSLIRNKVIRLCACAHGFSTELAF